MTVGIEGRSRLYLHVNCNKKSVTLDCAKPEGRKVLEAPIATSDVGGEQQMMAIALALMSLVNSAV